MKEAVNVLLTLCALVLARPLSSQAQAVTFDFDTGVPATSAGQNTPLDQTSGGVTAHFSSPSDPAFSVQNPGSTQFKLSQFSGDYLDRRIPAARKDAGRAGYPV